MGPGDGLSRTGTLVQPVKAQVLSSGAWTSFCGWQGASGRLCSDGKVITEALLKCPPGRGPAGLWLHIVPFSVVWTFQPRVWLPSALERGREARSCRAVVVSATLLNRQSDNLPSTGFFSCCPKGHLKGQGE